MNDHTYSKQNYNVGVEYIWGASKTGDRRQNWGLTPIVVPQ
jgi:hypothetical protein